MHEASSPNSLHRDVDWGYACRRIECQDDKNPVHRVDLPSHLRFANFAPGAKWISALHTVGWQLLLLGMVCDLGKTVAPSVFGFNADCRLNAARGLAKFMIPQELARLAVFRGGANV